MLLLQHFTKQCCTCKTIKYKTSFFKNKARTDGSASECKDCVKIYQTKNKERISKYSKQYEVSNKEKISNRRKQERANYPDKFKKRSLNYRNSNKESIAEYKKEYVKTPKGIAVTINVKNKRRAREKSGKVSSVELMKLQQISKTCYWCGCNLKNKKTNLDHYIPLAKDGEHEISNLVVACEFCNKSKGAKDPITFANSIGKLL